MTLFKINTTSPLLSYLAVLFLVFILGSKNAYATIEHIIVNIKLNKLASIAWNICHPDQHATDGNYVNEYTPLSFVSHVINEINVSVIGKKNNVTTIDTPDLKTWTGHIHLNLYLENEYDTYIISAIIKNIINNKKYTDKINVR